MIARAPFTTTLRSLLAGILFLLPIGHHHHLPSVSPACLQATAEPAGSASKVRLHAGPSQELVRCLVCALDQRADSPLAAPWRPVLAALPEATFSVDQPIAPIPTPHLTIPRGPPSC